MAIQTKRTYPTCGVRIPEYHLGVQTGAAEDTWKPAKPPTHYMQMREIIEQITAGSPMVGTPIILVLDSKLIA